MAYINEKYAPEDKTTELEKRQNLWRATLLALKKAPIDQSQYRTRADIINQGGIDATNYESLRRNQRDAAYMERQQRNLAAMQSRNVNVNLPGRTIQGWTPPGGGNVNIPGATGTFAKFLAAISGQESGGNYSSRNRSSGAMGKYQIMPGNIAGTHKGWDYEALGRDISSQQFMQSPQLQEAIARYKLQQYYNKYGPRGAAIAWYAGPGAVGRAGGNKSQGAYPTINQYADAIMRRLGLG